MIVNPVSAAVGNTVKVAVAVASTTAQELPSEAGALYFITTTTAVYVKFGGSGVAAASSTEYTLFLPAGWSGHVRVPGDYVRAIRDSADGTMVLHKVNEDRA